MNKLNNILFAIAFLCLYISVRILTIFLYIIQIKRWVPRKKRSVLFLENFPIENAGYQYRAYKWIPYFKAAGYKTEVWTIEEDKKEFDNYLEHKHTLFLIKSMCKRFIQIIKSRKFEVVIVRRELLLFNDYGNLFMEKFLLKIHPNAILDFDDDIAASKQQPKKITSLYGKLLMENGNKFNETLNLYNNFIVGTKYLKSIILKRRKVYDKPNICVIPTCVDYDKYPPKDYTEDIKKITFGWIGGNHNYHLLENLIPVFNKLAKSYKFKLLVIGGTAPEWVTNFDFEFIPWSLKTEVQNLYKIDIGLMPLVDNAENRGKSGFKLIQYMGLGIVSIAKNLTINGEIVNHRKNSFLINEDKEWEIIFIDILENKFNLRAIGLNARQTVNDHYTFKANIKKYCNLIN